MCIYCKKADFVPTENYLIYRFETVGNSLSGLQLYGVMFDDGTFGCGFGTEGDVILSQEIQFKYCPMCGRKFEKVK